jgi:hypothetical protein
LRRMNWQSWLMDGHRQNLHELPSDPLIVILVKVFYY